MYISYKNNLCHKIKNAKKTYYCKKFENCKTDSRKTWKIINSILSNKRKSESHIVLTNDNDEDICDSLEIANKFCNFFSTIADKLDEAIPTTDTDPMDYLPDALPHRFTPQPATNDEIIDTISSFQNKPCPVNSVPIYAFKKLATIIAPLLCDIFNCAIREGTFPDSLKLARVRPIYKSKNKKIENNYRPISLLLTISKFFEKLYKTRACHYLNEHNILYNRQFGFRKGHNTTDAFLHFVDEVVTALDRRLFTVTIYLDFSKAFKTVNKTIIIRKLDRYGFRNEVNDFLNSYLSDRKMYVNVNGSDSTVRTTNIGLPQGSVTSPWLFSLYINDMHRTSDKLNFIHFADDTTVYMS